MIQDLFNMRQALIIIFSVLIAVSFTFVSAGCSERGDEKEASHPSLVEEGTPGAGGRKAPDKGEEKSPREKERLAEEERKELEDQRRENYGEYYVPLPPLTDEKASPVKARGLYLTGHSVGHPRYGDILEMVENTELNSLVIDAKDDHGLMSYSSSVNIVEEVGADDRVPVSDMREVLEDLDERDVFSIARVVVFKDPHLAEEKPEWAIQRKEGDGIWRDSDGVGWLDPYNKDVWDYNIAVAREAALMGFQEIQFDYVRFPENAKRMDREAEYTAYDGTPKDELIQEFLHYAAEKLEDYNVYLSADVFGVITTSWGDTDRIGQTWEKLSSAVDYICPMVYPSHYGPGYFDLDVPDAYPRRTVTYALRDAIKRNAPLEDPGILRPWLQSFTASWVRGNIPYGPEEVRAQIDAAYELGIEEFLLWDPNNNYGSQALLSEEESRKRREELARERRKEGKDALGRTPAEAVEKFLDALEESDWRKALPLHSSDTLHYHNYSRWMRTIILKSVEYSVDDPGEPEDKWFEDGLVLDLEVELSGEEGDFVLKDESWEVFLENRVWRVDPSEEFMDKLEHDKIEQDGIYNQDFRKRE